MTRSSRWLVFALVVVLVALAATVVYQLVRHATAPSPELQGSIDSVASYLISNY